MSENKERLTYRPEPETRQKIEQWYEADNCRSMNEFIDKAVRFYADWLSANRNDMLPMAIASAMNGRLKSWRRISPRCPSSTLWSWTC